MKRNPNLPVDRMAERYEPAHKDRQEAKEALSQQESELGELSERRQASESTPPKDRRRRGH